MGTMLLMSLMMITVRYRDTSLAMCEYSPLAQGELNDCLRGGQGGQLLAHKLLLCAC